MIVTKYNLPNAEIFPGNEIFAGIQGYEEIITLDLSNLWIKDIFTKVYAKVKALTSNHLKSRYPKVQYTKTDNISDTANFPTIYMHQSSCVEIGQDIENTTVNACRLVITIKVTSNREEDADYSIWYVLMGFKALGFDIPSAVIPQNIDKKYIKIANVSRIIGSADVIG